jgi:serine/threonine protein kinase
MHTQQINPTVVNGEENNTSPVSETLGAIQLADYQLVSRLGSGGYGEVWKAIGPGGLPKAVKILYGQQNEAHAESELKALERMRHLRHPFLLNIERIEVVDSRLVVVTELADCSLADRFEEYRSRKKHGIPRDELLGYLKDAADALDFMAEQHGLQHLDIKPDNLLLQGDHAKVGDFGLAKDLNVTNVSVVNGFTPLYAAPELFEGRPGRASDQYSLAIVYQIMLTGQAPFNGRTAAQLTAQHLRSQPDLFHLQPIDRPVVARALSKNQNSRYENCRHFVEELQRRRTSRLQTGVSFDESPHSSAEVNRTALLQTPAGEGGDSVGRIPSTPVPIDAVEPSDCRLRPTVFIGVGGLAGNVMVQLKNKFIDNEHCNDTIQFLQIDTNRDALQSLRHSDDGPGLSAEELLAMPLRTSAEYRSATGMDLSWMSRRWLFNIPRTGHVEGIRPLGRLALCDHRRTVRKQIKRCLLQASSENTPGVAERESNVSDSSDEIDVYIVASTVGGTGSGAVADVGLIVQSLARSDAFGDVSIQGILLHGTGSERSATDVQDANTVATLKELKHLSTAGMGAPRGFDRDPEIRDAAPFDHSYFVHIGNGLNDGSFTRKAAEVAEYLFLTTTTPASSDFRAWRAATPEHQGEPRRLRMLGFSSQQADAYNAAFQESSSLCTVLLRRWCGSVGRFVPEQRHEIPVELSDTQTLLTELNLTDTTLPEHVMTFLRGDCGKEVEAFAAEIFTRLNVTIPADTVTHGQALDFLQEQLSRKADAQDQRRTLHGIVSNIRKSLETITTNTQETVIDHLREILNSPHRLEGAGAAGHFMAFELQRTQAGCGSLVSEIEQTFASLATESSPESVFEAKDGVNAAEAVQAFTKQYCVLLAYQTIYHCFVQHVEAVSASVTEFLENQDRIQLELESVASEISTTQVLSSAVPQAIIDAFDRHLRSNDELLVSALVSGEIDVDEFRNRIVGEATHFLMSASDKYEGPRHPSGRKTYRFPEGAWSLIRGFGGERRVLGLIPEWLNQVDWKDRFEQSFGKCVATRHVPNESISVVCEMSNVPVDAVMASLTCNNPHVNDIAGRIHTRSDVDW